MKNFVKKTDRILALIGLAMIAFAVLWIIVLRVLQWLHL